MTLILFDSFPDIPGPAPPAPEEMDSEAAAKVMVDYFTAQWGATTLFRIDNEGFDPRTVPAGQSWLDIVIAPVVSRQATLGAAGNRKFYRQDLFVVTIASPRDKGPGPALRLAEQVRRIFEAYRNGGLYVTSAVVRRQGNDSQWLRVVVDVAFNYHELK